jgi:adenylate cyclase class IV
MEFIDFKQHGKGLEYEYRYIDYSKIDIVNKLKANGGIKKGTYLFKVMIFTHPNKKSSAYIRVRDEGFRSTLTYKVYHGKFPDEQEIQIDNFATGVKILKSLGCKKKYYYEKIREIWDLDLFGSEIVFDTNPGRIDIMEVESKDLTSLESCVKMLGLENTKHNNFDDNKLYTKHFGIDFKKKDEDLTFKSMVKILKPLVTKNKKEFDLLVEKQIEKYNSLI